MGQVTVSLNGRTYRLRCGDGEEPRLLQLAGYLREKIDQLSAEFGQIGDERLTVMAALLITDELFDLKVATAPAKTDEQAATGQIDGPLDAEQPLPAVLTEGLNRLSEAIGGPEAGPATSVGPTMPASVDPSTQHNQIGQRAVNRGPSQPPVNAAPARPTLEARLREAREAAAAAERKAGQG